MIKFEIIPKSPGVEVLVDSKGVDELIEYLQFIRTNNESFHLTAGNEFNEKPGQKGNDVVVHVKLIYF